MEHMITALGVVLPIFTVIAIGYLFRWRGLIDEHFVGMAMKVVFNACLPSLLFLKVSKADISVLLGQESLYFGGFAFVLTILLFFIARGVAKGFIQDEGSRGTFVQGAFRSNYVILGYAVLHNLFGDAIVGRMAILLVVIIPLYNVLAVWVLSEKGSGTRHDMAKSIAKKIATNPLIVAIVIGFLFSMNHIPVPEVLSDTMTMLGAVGTPLGLLGIGAYLNFSEMGTVKDGLKASLLKVVVFPAIATTTAILMGFSYVDAAIIFVLFGSPAAISSFIMATALGGNGKLAANIVIISTGMSLLTFVVGLTALGLVY